MSLSAYLTALLDMREKRACLAVSSLEGLESLLIPCKIGLLLEPGEGNGEGVEINPEEWGWYC